MIISTTPGFLRQDFINGQYLIRDTSPLSPNYFDITFFPEYVGGGVSLIKLRGNEDNLATNKLTQVEILDVQGTPVRHEIATHIDRFQNYYVSIYVYDTTAPGIGTVSFVGTAKQDEKGRSINPDNVNELGHNVIWTRPLTILPYARNNSELVFDDPPFVSVAQVITQARVAYNDDVDTRYSAVTASNLTVVTSNFKGFDNKRASNFITKNGKIVTANKDKIIDKKAKQVNVSANGQAKTVNNVEVPTRSSNRDIVGGFTINESNKYNTVIIASESFFSSSYIGGVIGFFTNSYQFGSTLITASAYDESGSLSWIGIPTGYDFSNTSPYDSFQTVLPSTQSLQTQLARWQANIVKIKNDRIAFLDQPIQVDLRRVNVGTNGRGGEVKHIFDSVTNFTASILYTPDSLLFTTSSEVSQSYLQFTIQDLKPIGGLVDKIRIYYRRGSEIGDWELLNDQLIFPVEYLTDARYPNQTNYGLDISDYYLIGHFTDQTVIDHNWTSVIERSTTFDTTTASLDNSTLLNSTYLYSTGSGNLSKLLTTRFYQNYADNSIYSLSFNCILGPYTQLELYKNSGTLQTTVFESDPFPKAFDKTLNYELSAYPDRYNRYGKLIGKIINSSSVLKDYTRVVFDFKTDSEGLGRPLFRIKQITGSISASAYVSEVSVSPRMLNSFTPSTVQFAFPAKLDTNIDLNETIDYKLEYYDYTGNQSEYVTYLEDNRMELQTEIPTTACQSENLLFKFQPLKYYICDWDKGQEASQSILINYPSESLLTYITSTGFVTGALADIPEEAAIWPDWDFTSPFDGDTLAQEFYDEFFKVAQNYSLGTPNFTTELSQSLNSPTFNFWNILRPSMSIVGGNAGSPLTSYIPQYPFSMSVDDVVPGPITYPFSLYNPDVASGTITSSWQYVDSFTMRYVPGTSTIPQDPGGPATYTKNVYRRAYRSGSTTALDGRIFWEEGGVGITRFNVSNSFYSYSIATTNAERTEALKKRRLYWPASSSTYTRANYFTQNGGIYNVKFKLKRYNGTPYSGVDAFAPNTGSYMRVFIFDVSSSYTTSSTGVKGWYPPDQNIVKIGHAYSASGVVVPEITFSDSATGYYYDEYNINLVQYGTPGHLVFEPSGQDDSWFGVIVDDIQVCKIGVTIDPYFIQPSLVGNSAISNNLPPNTIPEADVVYR